MTIRDWQETAADRGAIHRRCSSGCSPGTPLTTSVPSLDLLVWQLILANNKTPLENAAFPIFKDERGGFKELKAGNLGVVKGACQDAIDMIVALKPYQGGNDALWRLHRLNATDKHRVLLTAGAGWSSVTMSPVLPAGTEQIPFLHLNWSKKAFFPLEDSTEKQLEFFRAMSHVPVEMKFELSFDVTFREPEVVEAEPVLPTLVQLSDYVEGVVRSFGPLL